MSMPPPLPFETLNRVVRISGIDGRILVFLAGGFGILSAFGADWLGAITGGLAAAAGWIELRGRSRLRSGDATGTRLLIQSQCLLLAVVLAYVVYQYFAYDPLPMIQKVDAALLKMQQQSGLDPVSLAEAQGMSETEFAAYLRSSTKGFYIAIGLASILCQGGLAYYYHRKGRIIGAFLRKT